MKQINVSIVYNEKFVVATSNGDEIILDINADIKPNENRQDFAVWLFLPIAMRTNANLHIEGKGTQQTVMNAKKMSQIWASWMPGHFNDVDVTFDSIVTIEEPQYTEDYLAFYSGGVDSTYCIGNKFEKEKKKISLLTVHGMDYSAIDDEKFNKFIEKTDIFASFYANRRLFVRTNAYAVYSKYKINTKLSHVTHIFTLAGCGFLFSGYYKNIIIAADYRLDQQHLVSPWGSNSATNFLFDDGITSLLTENDDVTRSEKMEWMISSDLALQSSTFCSDKKYRPNNCGVCSKCTRTKLMFLAATGSIPNIFLDMKLYNNAPILKVSRKSAKNTFLLDLYFCAKNNNRLELIPGLKESMKKIEKLNKFRFL